MPAVIAFLKINDMGPSVAGLPRSGLALARNASEVVNSGQSPTVDEDVGSRAMGPKVFAEQEGKESIQSVRNGKMAAAMNQSDSGKIVPDQLSKTSNDRGPSQLLDGKLVVTLMLRL